MSGLAPHVLVIDVPPTKLSAVVDFWAATLGATPRPLGGGSHPFVALDGASSVLQVMVQAAPGVARYHLDLPAADVAVAAQRLIADGATQVRSGEDHRVLRDPAGLLFCLTTQEVPHPPTVAPRASGRAYLDGLFVDVPGSQVDGELTFWSSVFDAEVEATSRPDTFTALTGVQGPGGDLLVEVQRLRDGAPRFHVDLSTDDVDAEARRIEGLGAMRVGQLETWTTFADPAGNLFCVVPA